MATKIVATQAALTNFLNGHPVPPALTAARNQASQYLANNNMLVRISYQDAAPGDVTHFEAGMKPINWVMGQNDPLWTAC